MKKQTIYRLFILALGLLGGVLAAVGQSASVQFLCGYELNGYTGTTRHQVVGNADPACALNNPVYLQFIPCEPQVQLDITLSQCTGAGVEAFIGTLDANTNQWRPVTACQSGANNQTLALSANGLQIGAVYTLAIDGNNGGTCGYSIQVIDGISVLQDSITLNQNGSISGPTEVCSQSTVTYLYQPPMCQVTNHGSCGMGTPAGDSAQICWEYSPYFTASGDSCATNSLVLSPNQGMIQDTMQALLQRFIDNPLDSAIFNFSLGDISVIETYNVNGLGNPCPPLGSCPGPQPLAVNAGMNLQILPTTVICPGETVQQFGQTWGAGMAINFANCQVQIQLIEEAVNEIMLGDFSTCVGTPFMHRGQSYTTSGTYRVAVDNCTEEVFTLTVLNASVVELGTIEICAGSCFSFAGTDYCAAQSYSVATSACEVTNFTIVQSGRSVIYQVDTLCAGDCFSFYGQELCRAGSYTHALSSTGGCDTLVELQLVEKPREVTNLGIIDLCPGTCYSFAGTAYCQPGTYQVSTDDCAETQFTLIERPFYILSENVTVCQNECYPFGGLDRCATGTYYDTLRNAAACDTLRTLNLTVQPRTMNDMGLIEVCSGECFNFDGVDYCISGTYEIATDDCQTARFFVSIVPPKVIGRTVQICPGACYDFYGRNICTPGVYEKVLTGAATGGCDTIVNLLVTIAMSDAPRVFANEDCLPSYSEYLVYLYIDEGQPPYFVDGAPIAGGTFTSPVIRSGTPYSFEVTDSGDCLEQEVIEGSMDCGTLCGNTSGRVRAPQTEWCIGEDESQYAVIGNVQMPDQIGEFLFHSDPNRPFETRLEGDYFGRFPYNPGLMTADQVYYVSYAIGAPDQFGLVDKNSACLVVSPPEPAIWRRAPQITVDSAADLNCIAPQVTLNASATNATHSYWLTPNQDTVYEASFTTNAVGSYQFIAHNGAACRAKSVQTIGIDTLRPAFTYLLSDTILTCRDSVITLSLNSTSAGVFQTERANFITPLQGDTQAELTEPGTYTVTFIDAANGCRSTQIMELESDQTAPRFRVEGSGALGCANSKISLEIVALSDQDTDPSIEWKYQGVSIHQLSGMPKVEVGIPGFFAAAVRNERNGCTTQVEYELKEIENQPKTIVLNTLDANCFNEASAQIMSFAVDGGQEPFKFLVDGQEVQEFPVRYLPKGEYAIELIDANGCRLDTLLFLDQIQGPILELPDHVSLRFGDTLNLAPLKAEPVTEYLWTWEREDIGKDSVVSFVPFKSGPLRLTVLDSEKCNTSRTTFVELERQENNYLPNVFSPNNDGNNDYFQLFPSTDVVEVLDVQIYNRWGAMVHQKSPFNDKWLGWNGQTNGRDAPTGVYVYRIRVLNRDGTKLDLTGDVTILR